MGVKDCHDRRHREIPNIKIYVVAKVIFFSHRFPSGVAPNTCPDYMLENDFREEIAQRDGTNYNRSKRENKMLKLSTSKPS